MLPYTNGYTKNLGILKADHFYDYDKKNRRLYAQAVKGIERLRSDIKRKRNAGPERLKRLVNLIEKSITDTQFYIDHAKKYRRGRPMMNMSLRMKGNKMVFKSQKTIYLIPLDVEVRFLRDAHTFVVRLLKKKNS